MWLRWITFEMFQSPSYCYAPSQFVTLFAQDWWNLIVWDNPAMLHPLPCGFNYQSAEQLNFGPWKQVCKMRCIWHRGYFHCQPRSSTSFTCFFSPTIFSHLGHFFWGLFWHLCGTLLGKERCEWLTGGTGAGRGRWWRCFTSKKCHLCFFFSCFICLSGPV